MTGGQLTVEELERLYTRILLKPPERQVQIVSPAVFNQRLGCPLWSDTEAPGHIHDERCAGLDIGEASS